MPSALRSNALDFLLLLEELEEGDAAVSTLPEEAQLALAGNKDVIRGFYCVSERRGERFFVRGGNPDVYQTLRMCASMWPDEEGVAVPLFVRVSLDFRFQVGLQVCAAKEGETVAFAFPMNARSRRRTPEFVEYLTASGLCALAEKTEDDVVLRRTAQPWDDLAFDDAIYVELRDLEGKQIHEVE